MSRAYRWFNNNVGFSGLFVLGFAVLVFGFIVSIIVLGINGTFKNSEHREYLKSYIGNKYVVGKDTVFIYELDEIRNVYLLSNGQRVVPEIIYNSKKVK